VKASDRILWVDCLGGLAVGLIVFVFCRLISEWQNLPLKVVLLMGAANLIYGCYSLYVTTRKQRPSGLVKLLSIANMVWLLVCSAIVVMYWSQISLFGMAHVIGEGIYVAGLGFVEWKMKESLATV